MTQQDYITQPADWDIAHEIWAAAQTPPGTSIESAVERIVDLLSKLRAEGVPLCTICQGYGQFQDGDSGTDADGRAPHIVECECDDSERRRAAPVASAPADERISLRGAANLAFNALHECKPAKGAEKQYSDAIQALQSALHDIAYTVNRTATPQQFADHLQREARAALASAPVAGHIVGIDAFRTGVGETSATFKTTAFGVPVAGEARPTDAEIIDLAVEPLGIDCDRMPYSVVVFARALLSRYAAPQASEAVRDARAEGFQAGLDKALEVLDRDEFATRLQSAQVIRALKSQPQADKEGGQWEPLTPEQIVADMRNFALSEGFDWPEPAKSAGDTVVLPPLPQTIAWATVNPSLAAAVDDLRRTAVLADRQQRAGDAHKQLLKAAETVLSYTEAAHRPPVRESLPTGATARVRIHALADLQDAVSAALSATQTEQGERDE